MTNPRPGTPLTTRELQIIAGLARGQNRPAIAHDLILTPLTIKSHLTRITRRTGAHGTSGIVGHAYRAGLLPGLAPEPRKPVTLTAREQQVLDGMARGQTNAEIGRELSLAEDTIKCHARTLLRKLRANSRAHAVALGYQHGHLRAAATQRSAT